MKAQKMTLYERTSAVSAGNYYDILNIFLDDRKKDFMEHLKKENSDFFEDVEDFLDRFLESLEDSFWNRQPTVFKSRRHD